MKVVKSHTLTICSTLVYIGGIGKMDEPFFVKKNLSSASNTLKLDAFNHQ